MSNPLTDRQAGEEQGLSDNNRKRLVELAEGWENAARLENEIVKAFAPELDAFTAPEARDGHHDIRLIRSVVDARSNRDTYLKDAAAVREALALLSKES